MLPALKARSLADIDDMYSQEACLKRGRFGTLCVALKKQSFAKLCLKNFAVDDTANPTTQSQMREVFKNELHAITSLQHETSPRSRFLQMVDCFVLQNQPNVSWLVMEYFESSLADSIENNDHLTERRIAWYMMQICSALATAHAKGICHGNLKPTKLQIDVRRGGNLVLSGWGHGMNSIEDVSPESRLYLAPEVLKSYRINRPGNSRSDRMAADVFAAGCILLELISGNRLISFPTVHGRCLVDVLRSVSPIDLLKQVESSTPSYTKFLQDMLCSMLQLDPQERSTPESHVVSLESCADSSLLRECLPASSPVTTGDTLTMDNIQLGLFVQIGPDLIDRNCKMSLGWVGIITELHANALVATVTWPNKFSTTVRIGNNQKFDLVVGPTIHGKLGGMVSGTQSITYTVGDVFRDETHPFHGFVVVKSIPFQKKPDSNNDTALFLLPQPEVFCTRPTSIFSVFPPTLPKMFDVQQRRPFEAPRLFPQPTQVPGTWDTSHSALLLKPLNMTRDYQEYTDVCNQFRPLTTKGFGITMIERVQAPDLWHAYVEQREKVARENWGYPNEKRLFHGTREVPPHVIVQDDVGFDPRLCNTGLYGRGSYFAACPCYSANYAHKVTAPHQILSKMFIARVSLGRIEMLQSKNKEIKRPLKHHHSIQAPSPLGDIFVTFRTSQAFPEYVVTYTSSL